MSWVCRLVDAPTSSTNGGRYHVSVGDMFFSDGTWWGDGHLSDYYHKYNAGRRTLLITLPPRTLFCLDAKCYKSGKWYDGWIVTGEPPLITVSPSINTGSYHGFLRDGIIGNDVEGRNYDIRD